ncbi:MAPEG family protein [Synechococcus sp. RSCCF101]|uniref:MAPEG family protein n=1 Tax=Synechococcus sp. RSCCF101 TaxID=2511069 RepID=UPI0012460F60|nr:MAPEG family protein [Synechococcus sp. RSCCF101]QEY32029.1 MAPEG family protein [Synechococcus sp. RSCCF101]
MTSDLLHSPTAPYALSLMLSAAVVLVALVPLGAARSRADFQIEDLGAPRAMFERLPMWGKRASWAQQNGFEAFGLHAPACLLMLVASLHSPAQAGITTVAAALLHPLLRLLYLAAYVAGLAPVRSLCWAAALLCSLILYRSGLRGLL